MSVDRITQIILDQLFDGDTDYLQDALDCAQSIVDDGAQSCNS